MSKIILMTVWKLQENKSVSVYSLCLTLLLQPWFSIKKPLTIKPAKNSLVYLLSYPRSLRKIVFVLREWLDKSSEVCRRRTRGRRRVIGSSGRGSTGNGEGALPTNPAHRSVQIRWKNRYTSVLLESHFYGLLRKSGLNFMKQMNNTANFILLAMPIL